MGVRKKIKKTITKDLKQKKPIQTLIEKSLDNEIVKSSRKLATNSRKREAAALNGDENHNGNNGNENNNGERYSKRLRISLVASQISNQAAKISPKPTTKARSSKVDSSTKRSMKLTTVDKKLKNIRKLKKETSLRPKPKSISKKLIAIATPKKIRITKKIATLNETGNTITIKKKRASKRALVPKDFVTEYIKEPTFETRESIPHVSTVAHSRLLIRAINLNDTKMLKSLISDKKSICSFTIPRSLNINRDAFSYAIEKQNIEAIKILLNSKLSEKLASFPDVILAEERTGHNSTMMFGHALRTVTIGRGGKEGNNALLKDRDIYTSKETSLYFISNDMTKEALSFGLPRELIRKLSETLPKLQSNIYMNFLNALIHAIRAGHNQLAGQLVEEAITKGGYGFNVLHKEVLLSTSEPLSPFKSVSVIKKATYNDRVTPLHCAAINPNPDYLTALLNSRPDYSILDMQNWSVIHYASVCTGTGPLQLLISRGISTLQMNKDGDTPLHLASALGRIENVKLILKNEKEKENEVDIEEADAPKDISGPLVKRTNKVGQTALHKAAATGQIDIIHILLAAGSDPNQFTPARHDKLTPFMLAARHGHVDVLKTFVQHGYMKIDAVDHKGRSALAHAIINGQAHVASYLLRIGANNLKKDTSGNTLVHYAAAYGWYFCLKLLMEAGCPPNEPNDWKMTPLAISFMKGHMGLVEFILKQTGVDIDSRINDSTGVTLLLQAVSSHPNKEFLNRLKFLLIDQEANCNIGDFKGSNAFHYLVKTEFREMSEDPNYSSSETQKIVFQATKLLWNHKCDPYARKNNQETAISLAVQYACFPILNHIYDLSPVLPEEPNEKGDTLLHKMVNQAHNEEVIRFCERLKKDASKVEILKRMAATYNDCGYTPLLWLLHRVPQATSDRCVQSIIDFIHFLAHTLNSDVTAIDREEKSGQSVTHLASNVSYAEEALKIILPMQPQLEVVNFNLQTPLTYAIVKGKEMAAAALLRNGANVNVTMKNMNSLLLLHSVSQNRSFHLIPLMIDMGANVHEVNIHTKNSILHYVCRKPHLPFAIESLRKLVEKKMDLDAVNEDGRTALHLAVNFRAGETDASYDIEDLLIESKAKLNIRDNRGRIPLHMAFVKIGKHSDSSFMDPIELVTTLVRAMKQSLPNFADEIRVADEFGMTPLHYAASRGATISCSYLLMEMNDNIDIPDKNGNTPFGLAVLHGHEGCALQFQQKGASFINNLNTNLNRCVPNEANEAWQWIIVVMEKEVSDRKKLEKENYPILQEVVSKDWQGILHLMLEKLNSSGFGASIPIVSAIRTDRLKLARKLLVRARPSELLVNENGETLLHILAKNVTGEGVNDRDLCVQVINISISKGMSYDSLDENQTTALIYAAANRNLIVCNLLGQPSITNINNITATTYADKFGRTPFTALFWNLNNETEFSSDLRKWAECILEQGANANACCRYPMIYPVVYPGVRFLNCEANDTYSSKFTPLTMAVIAGNYAIVEWLLTMKNATLIDVNFQDDDGRTALMHACRLNDVEMVRLIIDPVAFKQIKARTEGIQKKISTQNNSRLLINLTDKKGWTALDHVVAVHEGNYYYANSDSIVRLLFIAGAEIAGKSGDGVTPLERAVTKNRFHLVKCMENLLKVSPTKQIAFDDDNSEFFELNQSLPSSTLITGYDQDCQSMLESIETDEESDDENTVEPDELLNEDSNDDFKVMLDAEQQIHFSCCLTKVDISYGIYGMYNFYKMQLLKQDRGKELIVLFTRWGRVGDDGQFQRTPFPSEAEAINEFKKIFRSKTGNVWDSVDAFAPVRSKYRLVELETKKAKKLNRVKINFDDFQKSNNLTPSNLPLSLVKLMEQLVMAHKDSTKFSGEEFENELPLGRLTFERLKKGADLLQHIEELIKKRDEIKQKNLFSVLNEVDFMESVLKPCEEFYSLIPVYGYSKEKLKPMFTMDELREKQKVVHKLVHLEFASKLLIAAQYNLNAVNPFEYVFRCLNTKMESLTVEDEEAQLILQYIYNTSTHPESSSSNLPKLKRIFRLERSEEIERMKQSGIRNKHLLWHGTSAVNLLSILHGGLKVTPLEADLSGHLFGKGIYFADMFMKSQKYSHGNNPKFMLLCEVALGTIHSIKTNHWDSIENKPVPSNYHSLKTVDSRWAPDTTATVMFKGRTMPLGRAVENVLPEGQYHGLDHNEFVVFREDQVQLRYLVQYEDPANADPIKLESYKFN